MNTEFEVWGTGDFNCVMDTDLKTNMTFQQAIDEIEEAEVNYFYVSMCEEDVLEAVENEKDIAEALDLRFILIEDLGIYITTY